jgi:hypothetical protein
VFECVCCRCRGQCEAARALISIRGIGTYHHDSSSASSRFINGAFSSNLRNDFLPIQAVASSGSLLPPVDSGIAEPSSSAASASGASGLYTTSISRSNNVEPAFAAASSGGHYATLPLAAQGGSTVEQPVLNGPSQLAALAAHCRSVFESDSIIHSNLDRRFNSEYQDLHDEVPRDYLQIKKREVDLKATLDAFRQYSEVVSELIILQQQLPADMHVIKAAADLGGLAGGEKFKVGHVVFKFARDWLGIYGAFGGSVLRRW